MDEQQLRDDLVAIGGWGEPLAVPDTEDLDALDVRPDRGNAGTGTEPGSPWRRALLAAAAVLLVVGGVWVLTGRDDPETVSPTPTSAPTSTDPSSVGPLGWHEVPAAPLLPRAEAQVLWTGTEFVVFAGTDQAPCPICDYFSYGETRHDAAAYDPATNTWRTIADLPEASSYVGSSAVVDGDVYWMSVRNPSTNESGIDATLQRWSSADDTWTEVPLPTEVPPGPRLASAFVDGLVLYPATDEVGAFPDQLWQDGAWSTLPDDPLGPSYDRQIVDGGDTLVLFAKSLTEAQNTAQPSLVQGASLFSGEWQAIPDSDQLYAPMTRLGDSLYAPFGGGADGGDVGNWGRTVPNGGSYALETQTWSSLPTPTPEDLMGVVSADGTAVFGVKGSILDVDTGTYSTIPTLPDGIGDQFGQGIANGDGAVFTFGGGYSDAINGGLGVHGRAFVWRPRQVLLTPDTTPSESTSPPDTAAPTDEQSLLNTAVAELGIDPARAPDGALDLEGGRFCGYEVRGLTDSANDDGRACFVAAIDGNGTALFIQQVTTTEGDPVAYVWRTEGGLESLFIDSTRDNFGSGEWSQQACPTVAVGETGLFCDTGTRTGNDTPTIPVGVTSFCAAAVALLESPDLGAARELIADLRAVDTAGLTGEQRGTFLTGITALEDRVGSPDGYDTVAVTDAVNGICGTELSQWFATP